MTMGITDDRAVIALGQERIGKLVRYHQRAWTAVMRKRVDLPLAHPSWISSTLHQHVLQEIRTGFPGDRGFRVQDHIKSRFIVQVGDEMLLQFKKLSRMLPRNYPTATAVQFDRQEELEGLPLLPRVTVGCTVDRFYTNLTGVHLLLMVDKKSAAWSVDMKTGRGAGVFEFARYKGPSAADQEKAARRNRIQLLADNGTEPDQ